MTKIIDFYDRLPNLILASSLRAFFPQVSMRTIDRKMRGYVADGRLIKIKGNVYAKAAADQFDIAAQLYRGYIGLSSALYLHGLKTELEAIVYVCVPEVQKSLAFGNVTMTPIALGSLCYGTNYLKGVLVSSYPKTIFDMLFRPKHANFFDMYRAINMRMPTEDQWREVLGYLKKSNISTVRRAGHAFDGIAPEWFLQELERINPKKGSSFFVKNRKDGFDKKWLIYDDIMVRRWMNAV